MLFVETPVFTADAESCLSANEYRALQLALLLRPDAGAVIPASGGLRKFRWKQTGRGKRGGVRVIYYWLHQESAIYLLLLYRKARQSSLSNQQLRALRKLVGVNLNERS